MGISKTLVEIIKTKTKVIKNVIGENNRSIMNYAKIMEFSSGHQNIHNDSQ